MTPCLSQATTLSTPFEADLPFYEAAGFRHVEIWLTKLETFLVGRSIADAGALLADAGLVPVAAASQGGLLLSRGDERETHWSHFRRRLDWLGELAVPTLVIAADFVPGPTSDDYRRAGAALAEAASLAAESNVRLALEFQKGSGFCSNLETAVALLASSGGVGLGVCLDLFHYYTGPSKFEDLAYLTKDNLAHVQVCDLSGTPREVAGDSDRILPGEGDFQIRPILDHLDAIGYGGAVSVELLNPSLWAIPADRVADFARQALARTLGQRSSVQPSGGT